MTIRCTMITSVSTVHAVISHVERFVDSESDECGWWCWSELLLTL